MDDALDAKSIKKSLAKGDEPTSLVEIGPRFVLNIVRIFQGSFGGRTIFQNPSWVSPNQLRHEYNMRRGAQYAKRVKMQADLLDRKKRRELEVPRDPLAGVFAEEAEEDAVGTEEAEDVKEDESGEAVEASDSDGEEEDE